MRGFIYENGAAAEISFDQALSKIGTAPLVWVHLDAREPGARDWIEAQAGIPPTVRSALLASETRPRGEIIGQGALINLRTLGATPDDDPDALVSIRVWAEAGLVISVTLRSPAILHTIINHFLSGAVHDPGDLVSSGADIISDELDPAIADLGDELDSCEVGIESARYFEMRRKVTRARAAAIGYRRFVNPQRMALERLASAPLAWLDDDDRLHLREAADRAARMAEELEAVRERAALIHDELTDLRAEQLDGRALVLSIVALIFLPLTFITGLLGMNVQGIPYAEEPWAFWGVTGFCLLVALIVFGWFIRNRWLNARAIREHVKERGLY